MMLRLLLVVFGVLFSIGDVYTQHPVEKFTLIVFEGSDWCSNCKKLDKNILSKQVFVDFVESNNVRILKVDFPQRKKIDKSQAIYNEQLAEEYDFDGSFPTIILSEDTSGRFRKVNYLNQNAEEFMHDISSVLRWFR